MKNGFTLIELLAVIVILTIILIIAVPMIFNVIDETKKKAFLDTGYGILKSAELMHAEAIMSNQAADITFTYTDGVETSSPGIEVLNYKGKKPQNGAIVMSKNGEVELALHDGKFCVSKAITGKLQVSEKTQAKCKLPSLIVKPTAVITMVPNTGIDSSTIMSFNYTSSTADTGNTIVAAEWDNMNITYPEGNQTVKLRVKDSDDVWSEWVETTFFVNAPAFSPTTISAEKVLFTTDSVGFFEQFVDASGNINYFGFSAGTIFRKVVDQDGNLIVARQNLITGAIAINNNEDVKSFDIDFDSAGNFYIAYAANYSASNLYKKVAKFNPSGTLILNQVVYTDYAGDNSEGVTLDIHNDRIFFAFKDSTVKMMELNLDLTVAAAAKNIYPDGTQRVEMDIQVTDDKIYFTYTNDGSSIRKYNVYFSILNRSLVLTRTITIGSNLERYVNQILTDSLGRVWIVNNQKYPGSATSTMQLLNVGETAFGTGINITPAIGYNVVRASLLENGEMLILYRNTSIRSKYLQK